MYQFSVFKNKLYQILFCVFSDMDDSLLDPDYMQSESSSEAFRQDSETITDIHNPDAINIPDAFTESPDVPDAFTESPDVPGTVTDSPDDPGNLLESPDVPIAFTESPPLLHLLQPHFVIPNTENDAAATETVTVAHDDVTLQQ